WNAKCVCCPTVDDELKLCRLHNREFAGICAFEDFIHVSGRTCPAGRYTRAIGHQGTALNGFSEAVAVWQPIFAGKIHEHFPTSVLVCAGIDKKCIYPACSNESQSSVIIIRCVCCQNHRQAQLLRRNFYTLPPWTLPFLDPAEACYAACARQH